MLPLARFIVLVVILIAVVGCGSEDPAGPVRSSGSITGRVVAGPNAEPVPNAILSTVPVTANSVTSEDGTFTIPNVPPGTYTVAALRTSGGQGTTSVVVQAGRSAQAVILIEDDAAVSVGSIAGTVVNSLGQPIPDAVVTTTPTTQTARTTESGAFVLDKLVPQAYIVRVSKLGFMDAIVSVMVVANQRATVTIALQAVVVNPLPDVGTIRGTVRDQAGAPLRDILVSIDELNRQAITGADGQYVFNDVPSGSYRVRFRKSGLADIVENAVVTKNGVAVVNAVFVDVQDPDADNLIGYWPLDGDARMAYGGLSSGDVVGATSTADRRGLPNRALAFDGLSYVRIPHHPRLNELPLSVSFWMRADSWPSFTVVVGKFQHPIGEGWDVFVEGAQFGAASLRNDFRQYSRANGSRPTSAQWVHVCATYSSTETSIYVNGVRTAVAGWSGSPTNSTTLSDVFIGRVPSSVPNFTGFRGAIDEVKIYSKALTAAEIRALYVSP